MLHEDITAPLSGAFYDVHRELGHGFLESVYERAMVVALSRRGIPVERQVPVTVRYGGTWSGSSARTCSSKTGCLPS